MKVRASVKKHTETPDPLPVRTAQPALHPSDTDIVAAVCAQLQQNLRRIAPQTATDDEQPNPA